MFLNVGVYQNKTVGFNVSEISDSHISIIRSKCKDLNNLPTRECAQFIYGMCGSAIRTLFTDKIEVINEWPILPI